MEDVPVPSSPIPPDPPELDPKLLAEIAERFEKNDCCGRAAIITDEDLKTLGAWPVPEFFESSMGRISPLSGWNAKCLYVYEQVFQVSCLLAMHAAQEGAFQPCKAVARELKRLLDEKAQASST